MSRVSVRRVHPHPTLDQWKLALDMGFCTDGVTLAPDRILGVRVGRPGTPSELDYRDTFYPATLHDLRWWQVQPGTLEEFQRAGFLDDVAADDEWYRSSNEEFRENLHVALINSWVQWFAPARRVALAQAELYYRAVSVFGPFYRGLAR